MVKITFQKTPGLILPISSQHIVQGVLYSLLDKKDSTILHEKESYKDFTFSTLQGKYNYDSKTKTREFITDFVLYLNSYDDSLLLQIGIKLSKDPRVFFKEKEVRVKDFEIIPDPIPVHYNLISFLSPITVHRTLVVGQSQKTQYLTPDDPDFNSLISINAYKKAKELGLSFSESDCHVSLTEMSDPQKNKIKSLYKDFIIIGYQGTFALSGNSKVISFLLKTGIGCRNSSGFGMFELLR